MSLYQNDVVEEDDIRAWHARPQSKGIDLPDGEAKERTQKCWLVGAQMIHQFDEQESSEEGSDEDEDEESD